MTLKNQFKHLLTSPWRFAFWVLSLGTVISMTLMSRDYGRTWDEWMDSNNAMLALRNIVTLGRDREFMNFWHGYLYAQFFYTWVGTLYGLFYDSVWNMAHEGLHQAKNFISFYKFSHLMNALFGFWAMLTTGLIVKKISGWRAAFIALLFMALSPRFLGDSMNNPKDIPFAATYIFSLYCLTFLIERLPSFSIKTLLIAALGVGCCIGSRLGGLIVLFYTGLIALLSLIQTRSHASTWFRLGLGLTGVTLVAVAFGFLFWPYGRTFPPHEVIQAILKMTKFDYWDNLVLFEGQMITASKLPWYYPAKWILISTPFFFPVGLALWAFTKPVKPYDLAQKRLILLIALAGFFPLAFIIIRDSIIYDAWRHLTFIYPPLVALAAIGWDKLLSKELPGKIKKAFIMLLVLLCAGPLAWIIKAHPRANVYFNSSVGGLKGAFPHYESDYWGSCLEASARWLTSYHKNNYGNFPYALVWSDGQIMQTYPYLKSELGQFYAPFTYPSNFLETEPYFFSGMPINLPTDLPWNYAIVMSRRRTSEELKNNWPPPGTIHTIDTDGVPLCAVVKNEEFYRHLANVQQANAN